MSKVNVHTQYIMNTGDKVPGVTTVLNILNKPALVKWANNLGLKGIDSTKYKDKLADIGTITHMRIMDYLKHIQSDYSEYSQQDLNTSDNCMLSFYEWEKSHKLEPMKVEIPLTSDIYGFGGTPDFIGLVNGRLEIIDFKTGSGIYNDYIYQVAAYRQLAYEQNLKVEHARLLRIGREANEGFEEKLITKFQDEFDLFTHCLAIYNLLKVMNRKL